MLARLYPLLILATLDATPALATLGEKLSSAGNDRSSFAASRSSSEVKVPFTVHEVVSEGLTIREFAGADGTVFAVVWSGLSHPDLSRLLGTYMADFSQASAAAPKAQGRTPYAQATGNDVVVVKSGHMRAVHGVAYLPKLLPAGVTVDDLH